MDNSTVIKIYKNILLLIFLIHFNSQLLRGEVTSVELKPGIELLVDVSFLPEVLGEYKGEKILKQEFLPTVAGKLNLFAREKFTEFQLKQLVVALLREKYERLAALELAKLEGVEPNLGIAEMELANIEKELGKKGLTEKLQELGVSFAEAPRVMSEISTIDQFYLSKVLPANEVNEAEALVYYTDNKGQFDLPLRVKLAHIYIGFNDDATKKMAQEKISQASLELQISKNFAEAARKFGENPTAKDGGVEDRFYTENELPNEMKGLVNIEVGGVSSVIEVRNGFYLFQVLEKRAAGLVKVSEVKKGWMLSLSLEKGKQAMKKKVEEKLIEGKFKIFIK